jgi:hypothetical protein
MEPPKPVTDVVPDPLWTRVSSVFAAAVQAAAVDESTRRTDNEDSDAMLSGAQKAQLSLQSATKSQNRVDPFLFSNMSVLLSETLRADLSVASAISACGGTVVSETILQGNDAIPALMNRVTHVVYHHTDKKEQTLVLAAQPHKISKAGKPFLCTSVWLEDCLLLGELLPPTGPYVPTAKLLTTLQKKYEKLLDGGNVTPVAAD